MVEMKLTVTTLLNWKNKVTSTSVAWLCYRLWSDEE